MARKFSELRAKLPQESRDRIDQRAKELLAEMPLHQLRQALEFSQEQMAEVLGVNQSAISKMEHRPDMYISTLRRYIEAMGGELEVVATFSRGSVRIDRLGTQLVMAGDNPDKSGQLDKVIA